MPQVLPENEFDHQTLWQNHEGDAPASLNASGIAYDDDSSQAQRCVNRYVSYSS